VPGHPTPVLYRNLGKEAPQKRHGALVAHISPQTLLYCCKCTRGRFGAYPSELAGLEPTLAAVDTQVTDERIRSARKRT
jgi:hypothetical protein